MTPNSMATGRAVETGGEGSRTTAHLNLTLTLADAGYRQAMIEHRKAHRLRRQRELQSDFKHPYAGKEQ